MGVTGHFIDDNFNLNNIVLECIKFEGSHTADVIAKKLNEVFSSWVISNKVLIIITDNAPNIAKAVKVEMKKKILVVSHIN